MKVKKMKPKVSTKAKNEEKGVYKVKRNAMDRLKNIFLKYEKVSLVWPCLHLLADHQGLFTVHFCLSKRLFSADLDFQSNIVLFHFSFLYFRNIFLLNSRLEESI
jgi:hypothetical protein